MTTIQKTTKPINRLFILPSEIISYIYELAQEREPMNEILKNFNFHFKLYNSIKENMTGQLSIRIIKETERQYKYIVIIYNI